MVEAVQTWEAALQGLRWGAAREDIVDLVVVNILSRERGLLMRQAE